MGFMNETFQDMKACAFKKGETKMREIRQYMRRTYGVGNYRIRGNEIHYRRIDEKGKKFWAWFSRADDPTLAQMISDKFLNRSIYL